MGYKRLERGQFRYDALGGDKRRLDCTQLKLLLEGIEIKNTHQYKRYRYPPQDDFGTMDSHGIGAGIG